MVTAPYWMVRFPSAMATPPSKCVWSELISTGISPKVGNWARNADRGISNSSRADSQRFISGGERMERLRQCQVRKPVSIFRIGFAFDIGAAWGRLAALFHYGQYPFRSQTSPPDRGPHLAKQACPHRSQE